MSLHEYPAIELRARGALLANSFFCRPAVVVAQDLLDRIVVHTQPGGEVAGRIVETEAYAGETDQASHAYRGRTAGNATMFGPPGRVYVYRSYGIHHCMNVVTTQPEGPTSAVLLRALEPVDGLDLMRARRPHAPDANLLRGPGNVCAGMGIDHDLDGASLDGLRIGIFTGAPTNRPIITTTRIGITRSADFPWRFYLLGSPAVSKRDRTAEAVTVAHPTQD